MIDLEDRQIVAHNIQIAHVEGARLAPACKIAGIDLRTLQRWQAHAGLAAGDGRPQAVRPMPSHALTPDERAQLLAVANQPRFASVPPARIVPMLADEGVYLARRVRIVVVPIELNNERAAMKDFSGSIRTSIQRQSGGQVVAA